MLKGIPEILSPQLLKVLCEMGHSDRIVIADGNFPVESMGKDAIVVRCDGHGVPELLDAILTVIPLDSYVEKPVTLMEVMPGDPVKTQSGIHTKRLFPNMMNVAPKQLEISSVSHFMKRQRKHIVLSLQVRKLFTQTLCFRKVLLSTNNFLFQLKSSVGFPAELLLFMFIMIHYFSFFLKEPDYHCDANDNNYNQNPDNRIHSFICALHIFAGRFLFCTF